MKTSHPDCAVCNARIRPPRSEQPSESRAERSKRIHDRYMEWDNAPLDALLEELDISLPTLRAAITFHRNNLRAQGLEVPVRMRTVYARRKDLYKHDRFLELYKEGKSYRAIAKELGLSPWAITLRARSAVKRGEIEPR